MVQLDNCEFYAHEKKSLPRYPSGGRPFARPSRLQVHLKENNVHLIRAYRKLLKVLPVTGIEYICLVLTTCCIIVSLEWLAATYMVLCMILKSKNIKQNNLYATWSEMILFPKRFFYSVSSIKGNEKVNSRDRHVLQSLEQALLWEYSHTHSHYFR